MRRAISWDPTKTAAWDRSTWHEHLQPGRHASIGKSCARASCLSTRFLDDVVDANKYVPAVPQLQEAAHARPAHRPGHHGPRRPDVPRGRPLRLEEGAGIRRAGDGVRALPLHGDQHRTGQRRAALPGDRGQHLRSGQSQVVSRRSRWRRISTTGAVPPSIGMRSSTGSSSTASAMPPRPPSRRPAPSPPSRAAKATAASRSSRWLTSATSTITARTCS